MECRGKCRGEFPLDDTALVGDVVSPSLREERVEIDLERVEILQVFEDLDASFVVDGHKVFESETEMADGVGGAMLVQELEPEVEMVVNSAGYGDGGRSDIAVDVIILGNSGCDFFERHSFNPRKAS